MDSVVFVLVDLYGELVLMERRPVDADSFPGAWLFPGGKLDDGESPIAGLFREMREELGVEPLRITPLAEEDDILYAEDSSRDPAWRVYPYLVRNWRGRVPLQVLDTGHPLEWRTPLKAWESPIRATRRIALATMAALVPGSSAPPVQCHAGTRAGPRCRRQAPDGLWCTQHEDQAYLDRTPRLVEA